jgi:hypothetical protein
MKRELMSYLGGGVLLLGSACASAPAPNNQLASAQAAVRASKELGAERVPEAQLHQQLAEEQIQKARKLMQDDENERAEFALARAKADAELSVALARQEVARHQVEQSSDSTAPMGDSSIK